MNFTIIINGKNVNESLSFSVKMYRDVKARVKLIGASGLNKVNSLRYDYRVQEEVLLTRIIVNLQRYRELKV